MAQRPFWTGYLKLSLVTCRVSMSPARTENDKVRFHVLSRKTGNRVDSQYVDSVTGRAVDDGDQVKGYPRGEDDYVLLEDDELEAVALESTRTIDVETFVEADSIDATWLDSPHYLKPDDRIGEEAFSVIREAMTSTGTVGLSRLVLYRRERAVMLESRDKGIILWTLRYGDEIRDPKDYFTAAGRHEFDPKTLKAVTSLIDERRGPWSPALVRDPVQKRLLELIKSKKKRGGRTAKSAPAAPATSGKVVNIMDALRASISRDKNAKRH
jgi:DNA end-binding protein Ku